MTLGERVRQVRTSLPGKVTQTEFAEMLGISRGEIANIEGDVLKKPEGKMPLLLLICSKFGIRKEWLLTGEEPMRLPEPDESLAYIDMLLNESENPFVDIIRKILIVYDEASPEDQAAIMRFARSILDQK